MSNHTPSFNRENSLGERVSRFISDEVQLNWDYNTVTVGKFCCPSRGMFCLARGMFFLARGL